MLSPKSELRIGNQWLAGEGPAFESIGPVDDQVVWKTNEASGAQVDQAFAAASDAFGPWWDQDLENRIAIAEKYAELVRASADELAEIISSETGKILWEAKTEAGAVAGKVDVSICLLYTSPSPRDLSTSRMPSSA